MFASSRPAPLAGWQWPMLVILTLLLWFAPLGVRDLINPDEGRYAELARGMLASGDWISPRLNGLLYFEKPPLQYWATAVAFALTGVDEFAARLWPALTSIGAVLAVTAVVGRILGGATGVAAGAVLGSSLWWIANGHFNNLDAALSSFLALAMLAFWVAQRDDVAPGSRRTAMLVVWAALGLGVLSKGLVALILPAGVLFLYLLVERDWRLLGRLHWLAGLSVFALITVPWFVLVSSRQETFAHFFFIHEHLDRFLEPGHRREGPWWYFLPYLVAGALPWTTLLPGAIAGGWRRTGARFQASRFLVLWCVFVFVFFSVSRSKLPSYILPLFPALAILVAQSILRSSPARIAVHFSVVGAFLGTAAATLALLPVFRGGGWSPEQIGLGHWLAAGLATACVGQFLAALLAASGRQVQAVLIAALLSLAGAQAGFSGHQHYAKLKSAKRLVAEVGGVADASAPWFAVDYYDQTLPFYLRRPVTLVNYRDEFTMGIALEPDKAIADESQFLLRWTALPRGVAVMSPGAHRRLQAAGLDGRLVYQDGHRIVVAKP